MKKEEVAERGIQSQKFSNIRNLVIINESWVNYVLLFLSPSFEASIDDVIVMTHHKKLSQIKLKAERNFAQKLRIFFPNRRNQKWPPERDIFKTYDYSKMNKV